MSNLKPNISTGDYQVRLSLNENPRSPQEILPSVEVVGWSKLRLNRYLAPEQGPLLNALSEYTKANMHQILLGNGGDELILALIMSLAQGQSIIVNSPTYNMYEILAHKCGVDVIKIPLTNEFQLDSNRIIRVATQKNVPLMFICRPHNPSGSLFNYEDIINILENTSTFVVVDEAYFEYAQCSMQGDLSKYKRLIVLRTLSKAFASAGLRLGYLLGDPEAIARIKEYRLPYSISNVAQFMGTQIVKEHQLFLRQVEDDIQQREAMILTLNSLQGVRALPSSTNFLLVELPIEPTIVRQQLMSMGIIIRKVNHMDPRLKNMIRVSVGKNAENIAFIKALTEILEGDSNVNNINL